MKDKYFKPLGDLKSEEEYFKLLEDLKSEEEYFKPLEELNSSDIKDEHIGKKGKFNNLHDVEDYLLTVVSGKKYDSVCELGVLMGAGRMIVKLEQLIKMVDEGYNIVSAEIINFDRNMYEIEFQRYEYDEEKMERWRRF